jgi:hypothetical protein
MAEAEVETAKEALVRKYELNYLEARRKYGKPTAEKLFSRINRATRPWNRMKPAPTVHLRYKVNTRLIIQV